MIKVFIDGSVGTTGLRIRERLSKFKAIELLEIEEEKRKDNRERAHLLNSADVAVLCLPDEAARQSVEMIQNPSTLVIDTSTAHRTLEDWAYGFPELGRDFRQKIARGKRIAVPGCHATGFIALVYPLVKLGLLRKDYPVVCHSVTGYSGGGKKMIADYTDPLRSQDYKTPRQYALGLKHKHLPEMKKYSGLERSPLFNPIVGDYYSGMAVSVPLQTALLSGKPTAIELHGAVAKFYAEEKLVRVAPFGDHEALAGGFLNPEYLSGKDYLEIIVSGHEDQAQLIALFDNLGKGASGAAVQCLNIACGLDEATGLSI